MEQEAKKIDDGGPAFPTENARQVGPCSWQYEGMTLRQWYAGQALAGYMAGWSMGEPCGFKFANLTGLCFEAADAMIAHEKDGR